MPEVYIGRCDKALTNELIETLNEVFFSEEPEETRNDFLGLLPKLYKDKYEPAYNNVIVAEDGKIKGAVGLFPMTAYVDGEEIGTIDAYMDANFYGSWYRMFVDEVWYTNNDGFVWGDDFEDGTDDIFSFCSVTAVVFDADGDDSLVLHGKCYSGH